MYNLFSKYADNLKLSELLRYFKIISKNPNIINFVNGLPDPRTVPINEITEITNQIIKEYSVRAFQYSITCGIKELKDQILEFVKNRGIYDISENNICITVGSQEALYMLFSIFINPGDNIAIENPTYISALETLRTLNPNFNGINITPKGYEIDDLRKSNAKLLYTVPSAQNPSGYTLNINERKKIIEIAHENNTIIIEDDTYGFLLFDDYVPAIKALDDEDKVIYVGSMSKVFSSGLRIGWIIANEKVIEKIEALKQNINAHSPTLNQLITAEAIRTGIIDKNIAYTKSLYKMKSNLMKNEIIKNLGDKVDFISPTGGMFFFLWTKNLDTEKLLEKAIKNNVAYLPGKYFYHDLSGYNTIRLSYSYPRENEIIEGIKRLGEIIS
ncbi:PLP-dependent aminotransferase family protein [Acidianus manzaensis]|uniref:aminotransferase-like domain-containing protein n=1 Tax=Acidianus manzaensis TaxID=282676 RepID=UPI00164F0377|nr:PLP-dependent aminotransferase family protein [Acidianus manzaensis]